VGGGGGSGGGGSGSTGCRYGSAGLDSVGGGDTGSSGGAGGHARGKAGKCSSSAGGNSVGEAVSGASEREGEDNEGGESGNGEAMQDGGERRRSPSPSTSRNNSTSLRRLRVLLAGGVVTSGEDGVGTSPDGAATAEAAVYVEGAPSVLLPTVVAARPRRRRRQRRRRHLTTVAAVAEGVGRLHVTVMTCNPAAWLNTTCAFKPLARQRSYSAVKSALETVGCSLEQAGSSMLPLTTLAHMAVGETREVAGRKGPLISWHPAGPAGSPATPVEGEAEWRGAWRADRRAAGL
jgi:hypothetical protein